MIREVVIVQLKWRLKRQLKKLKLWKLMIALVLVLSIIALLIIKKPAEEPEIVSNDPKESVFKVSEPDEALEIPNTKDFSGIEEVLKDPRLQGATDYN